MQRTHVCYVIQYANGWGNRGLGEKNGGVHTDRWGVWGKGKRTGSAHADG